MLWACVATAEIQPVFAKMFADYRQPVPGFTALCLQPWFPFALALVPFLVIAAGMIRRARLNVRAVLMACAITLTIVVAPAVFIFAMYLPIFSIAPVR
jgi:hypothetical protein